MEPPTLLQPNKPTIFNWSDSSSIHLFKVKHASQYSLWTESLQMALGEQLAHFNTIPGMNGIPDSESVLRVFGTTINHQMVLSFEFAVGLLVLVDCRTRSARGFSI